jgi:hypothetical protein
MMGPRLSKRIEDPLGFIVCALILRTGSSKPGGPGSGREWLAIMKSILSAVPARTIFEERIQGLVAGTTDRIR